MRKTCRKTLTIWLFLMMLAIPSLFGLQRSSIQCLSDAALSNLESRLQSHLDKVLAQNPTIPSLLVHVEAPGMCLSWSGAAGLDDRERGTSPRPEQTFRIASNTKTYTAAAILRLVEEGRLGLSQPLTELLPEEWLEILKKGGYSVERMTLAHVLTHTSGLFDHAATREYLRDVFGDPHRQWKREEQIQYCARYGKPHGPPGTVFSYSDTGYVMLGGLVEKLTGKDMAQAFRELLDFEGLGLKATWWETVEEPPDTASSRVHQYMGDRDTHDWNPSLDLYGGGGLVTSSRDLAHFLRSLMQGEVFVKKSTLGIMTSSQFVDDQRGYRMGIQRIEFEGKEAWGHTGFWNTFAYHFPEDDITVAGSVNQQRGLRGTGLGNQLFQIVLTEQSKRD